jgi:cysteine synthase A
VQALESGALRVGGVVTEGSAGSTAVSLAMVALAYGCRCHVVIPDDAAIEKVLFVRFATCLLRSFFHFVFV